MSIVTHSNLPSKPRSSPIHSASSRRLPNSSRQQRQQEQSNPFFCSPLRKIPALLLSSFLVCGNDFQLGKSWPIKMGKNGKSAEKRLCAKLTRKFARLQRQEVKEGRIRTRGGKCQARQGPKADGLGRFAAIPSTQLSHDDDSLMIGRELETLQTGSLSEIDPSISR